MKIHRVTMLVVDFDDIGAGEVEDVLEQTRYPNRCIMPNVLRVETRVVNWTDDHPLNRSDSRDEAVEALFGDGRK